jgi:hypothetical protein
VASRAVPVKTPEGQAELATRRLRLSQRHRTVLLLVDGKRDEAEVRHLAALAGVPATCFDELLGLSLIAMPDAGGEAAQATARRGDESVRSRGRAGAGSGPALPDSAPPADATDVIGAASAASDPPAAAAGSASARVIVAGPDDERAHAEPAPESSGESKLPVPGPVPFPIAADDSLLPAARTLPPDSGGSDSVLGGKPPPDSWLPAESEGEEGETPLDAVVAQARDMLVRAVRSEAPLAGTLTVLRLRRARDRKQLLELLDEVEARLARRQLSLAANQTLKSVRRLLERGEDGARSAA